MNTVKWFGLSMSVALLSGCGGGSNDNSAKAASTALPSVSAVVGDAQVSLVGAINVSAESGLGIDGQARDNTEVHASFRRLKTPLSAANLAEMDAEMAESNREGCTITVVDDAYVEKLSLLERIGSENISAGEVLVLSTPKGTLAELARDDVYDYRTDSASSAGLYPANTSIDIPGDAFPAFAARAIPVVEPIKDVKLLSEVPGQLTPASRITWTAIANPQRLIGVDMYTSNAQYPNGALIRCTTPDDGEFTFPANTHDLLKKAKFSDKEFDLTRYGVKLERSGNALLTISYLHRSAPQ